MSVRRRRSLLSQRKKRETPAPPWKPPLTLDRNRGPCAITSASSRTMGPDWACLFFLAGNSKPNHPHGHGHSAIKDLAGSILGCNEDKKDEGELWNTVEAQTAFLGPNLWDKTYESDLKVCIGEWFEDEQRWFSSSRQKKWKSNSCSRSNLDLGWVIESGFHFIDAPTMRRFVKTARRRGKSLLKRSENNLHKIATI